MKKRIIIAVMVLSMFFSTNVLAVNLGNDLAKKAAGQAGYSDDTGATTLAETIGVGIQAALSLVGMIFLILMVYAGYLWMTARGEEEEVKKAQKIITQAIIGLVIVTAAYAITYFLVPLIVNKVST